PAVAAIGRLPAVGPIPPAALAATALVGPPVAVAALTLAPEPAPVTSAVAAAVPARVPARVPAARLATCAAIAAPAGTEPRRTSPAASFVTVPAARRT